MIHRLFHGAVSGISFSVESYYLGAMGGLQLSYLQLLENQASHLAKPRKPAIWLTLGWASKYFLRVSHPHPTAAIFPLWHKKSQENLLGLGAWLSAGIATWDMLHCMNHFIGSYISAINTYTNVASLFEIQFVIKVLF